MTAAFWACALTEAQRERTAIRFLTLAGYETYCPWLSVKRSIVPLFPGYCFVVIADRGWWAARWSVAVRSIVGTHAGEPARVPDRIIAELRSRVVLPQRPGLRRGDRVRVLGGPAEHQLGIYDGQRPHERVAILLSWLGASRRIELPKRDVARVPSG